MSTNIKYTTYQKETQIYFLPRVQLTMSIPQPHPIFDVVVNDEV